MARVNRKDHIYAKHRKSENFGVKKRVSLRTLIDFHGLFELEGNWLMSRVRLFAEVRVDLNIRCRRDVDWGRRRVDGRRVKVCHLAG